MRRAFGFLIVTIFFISTLLSCKRNEEISIPEVTIPDLVPTDEVIEIPVVVHVVNYSPDPFVIDQEKITSQLEVLNQDYRKQNSDWTKTPEEFIDLVADVKIEFKLATVDPTGNPTTGIIRTESEVTGFDGVTVDGDDIENFSLYFSDKGGQNAWPKDQYLNIWIADLSDRHGNLSLAGYANPPGCDPRIDGVVIDPRVFGTTGQLEPTLNSGRTATHEIGHWLNLRHTYGKDGSCQDGEDGDLVDDTPIQHTQHTGRPVHPVASCGSNDMFMNFMDRVEDQAMYMFTQGQKQRMRALFNEGGLRRTLYLNQKK